MKNLTEEEKQYIIDNLDWYKHLSDPVHISAIMANNLRPKSRAFWQIVLAYIAFDLSAITWKKYA